MEKRKPESRKARRPQDERARERGSEEMVI
jgi:hypothetical protein